MNYKSYGTKTSMPRRMTRKVARRDVFVANKKMRKLAKKAARLERKSEEANG
jgi:hypothetical protein